MLGPPCSEPDPSSWRRWRRFWLYPADTLGLLGLDGLHANRRDRRGHGADPALPPALNATWFRIKPTVDETPQVSADKAELQAAMAAE